jgi:hypothetical protein
MHRQIPMFREDASMRRAKLKCERELYQCSGIYVTVRASLTKSWAKKE